MFDDSTHSGIETSNIIAFGFNLFGHRCERFDYNTRHLLQETEKFDVIDAYWKSAGKLTRKYFQKLGPINVFVCEWKQFENIGQKYFQKSNW